MSLEALLVVLIYGAMLAVVWMLPEALLGGKAIRVRVSASVIALAQMVVYALFG